MNFKGRLNNLRQRFSEKGIDAMLVSQPENRQYLSGFDGSAGYLLISSIKAVLATDFRYTEQAARQSPDYEVSRITGDTSAWFPQLIDKSGMRLGFESGGMTFAEHAHLGCILEKARSKIKLVPVDGLVESLRTIKDAEEIELITRAATISDAALNYIEGRLCDGITELEIGWEIEKFMREAGSMPVPFDVIVASGPNSALPHAKPSERVIQPGEPVIVDIGAKWQGYTSDLTRTICLGTPGEMLNKVYNIVRQAQQAAIDGTREEMTGEESDNLARKVITDAGYGEAFGHGLGHGVGLATHELPRVSLRSTDRLVNNMVFTIEPGIYIPGWGGVRIEDLTVMENGKVRVISKARKR